MGARGAALVQVLVMGVIMLLIAVSLLQWAFGRHQSVARHQYTTLAAGGIEGCLQEFTLQQYNAWSQGNPVGAYNCTSGNATVNVNLNAPDNYRLTITAPIPVP